MKSNYDYCMYDRHGKPITLKEWCAEFGNPHAFRKETVVNGLRILTKWTGVDMPEYDWLSERQFSMKTWKPNSKPMIFVSYVWNEDHQIVISKRYAKIEHAYEGHHKLIAKCEAMDFGTYHNLISTTEEQYA